MSVSFFFIELHYSGATCVWDRGSRVGRIGKAAPGMTCRALTATREPLVVVVVVVGNRRGLLPN